MAAAAQGAGTSDPRSRSRTFHWVLVGVLAAVLCILGPIAVPVGPVPISLATFGVILTAYVLGPKFGALSAAVYIMLGALGLPVFAGATGGIGKIIGPTGGYIIGYLALAFFTGLFVKKFPDKVPLHVAGALVGTVVLYALGTAWFIFVTRYTLTKALGVCVLPFLPGDAIKLAAAVIMGAILRKKLVFLP
ncbi:biotin biosynthesis protein BioY [Spirochaetia bacterium]|nr:biotin biosynthesis protein BioY [Spirochaetia bacterium]